MLNVVTPAFLARAAPCRSQPSWSVSFHQRRHPQAWPGCHDARDSRSRGQNVFHGTIHPNRTPSRDTRQISVLVRRNIRQPEQGLCRGGFVGSRQSKVCKSDGAIRSAFGIALAEYWFHAYNNTQGVRFSNRKQRAHRRSNCRSTIGSVSSGRTGPARRTASAVLSGEYPL